MHTYIHICIYIYIYYKYTSTILNTPICGMHTPSTETYNKKILVP